MQEFSPRLIRSSKPKPGLVRRWRVLIYNNNFHRADDVVSWLMKYTACDDPLAIEICEVCQEDGRAVCFTGTKQECTEVSRGLRSRGLQIEIDDFYGPKEA